MSREDRARSLTFRMAYWERIEELVPLMDRASQLQACDAANESLGKRDGRRYKSVAARGTGPYSVEESDEIAKRYALFEVRRRFDWRQAFSVLPPGVKKIHEGVSFGMFDLDVTLRRQIEVLLKGSLTDAERARELRTAVESRAGQVSADMDVGRMKGVADDDWDMFEFDEVCNSLDRLLSTAGSPRVY